MKLRGVLLLWAALAVACGPNVHLQQYATAPPQKVCDPKTLAKYDVVPPGSTLLAEVGYGDTGFSVSCGVARNLARLHSLACRIGADAIQIVAENYPNFVSTCYRVHAALYKLPSDTSAEQPPGAEPQ
jgi:hypothetical protein